MVAVVVVVAQAPYCYTANQWKLNIVDTNRQARQRLKN